MKILALDCGTTRIKAGLFHIPKGTSLDQAVRAPLRFWVEVTDGPVTEDTVASRDRSHLELEGYLERVFNLLKKITQEMKQNQWEISAICPAVCCPALVALDSNMRPLYPVLTHLHRGSGPQSRKLAETIGREEWLEKTGNLPVQGGTSITALKWLEAKQPRVVSDAAYWVHLHAVIIFSLTGRLVTDPTQAAYTGLYDVPHNTGWLDDNWLKKLNLRRDQLPEVVPSISVVGGLTPEAARKSGLPKGLPVVNGGADIPMALLTAEYVTQEGGINVSGTTEVVSASSKKFPAPSEEYLLRPHVVPGRWVVVKVSPVGGETLNWFRARFCREMSPERFWDWVMSVQFEVEEVLDDEAVTRGEGEIVEFIPYLYGDRHSLEPLSAAFTGLRPETTREDMLCAVLAAYRRKLQEAQLIVAAAVGRPLYHMVTSGGYDTPPLGLHRRAALNRSSLIPIEAAGVCGAAIVGYTALNQP